MRAPRVATAIGLAAVFSLGGVSAAHASYPPSGHSGSNTTTHASAVRSNSGGSSGESLAYTGTEVGAAVGTAAALIAGGIVALRRSRRA